MKRSRISAVGFAIACLLALALVCSCAQGKPEIRSHSVQLLRVQGPALTFAERLSVFVFFEDSDGDADFSSIAVTHAETGLRWNVPSNASMTRLRGKDRWIGSNNLAGPGDGSLPEGAYTIAVYDLAGNEAMATFSLTKGDFPKSAPARLSIEGDVWKLERNPLAGSFTNSWLFLFNNEQRLVLSWKVPSGGDAASGSVSSLREQARDAVSIQCYTENQTGSAGVLLTPVDLE